VPDAHGFLVIDQAGWRISAKLNVPANSPTPYPAATFARTQSCRLDTEMGASVIISGAWY
jgi:hypothetical protein